MLNKNKATKAKSRNRTKCIVGYTTSFLSGSRRGYSQPTELKGGKNEKRNF